VASAIAAFPSQTTTTSSDGPAAAGGVSVERVRAALERPPSRLLLPDKKPDFSIDILEREEPNRFMTPILDFIVPPGVPLGAPGAAFGSQPMVSVELLSLLAKARKAYAQHAAREEVRREIAAYCAAQPDRGAAIQICAR